MKKCPKCGKEKQIIEFNNNKSKKDGKCTYCRECELKRGREYREKNRGKVNEASRKWRKSNPGKYKDIIGRYLKKNPHMKSVERARRNRLDESYREMENVRNRMRYKENPEKFREKRKEYYHKNKENERRKNDEWRKKKLKECGFFRMKKNLRDRIRGYLTEKTNSKRTLDIVGLERDVFRSYIENKFTDGMSWDNYGKWHLDHIKPLCLAENNDEALKLNHYTNLQPLWAEDNLRKNRKYGT